MTDGDWKPIIARAAAVVETNGAGGPNRMDRARSTVNVRTWRRNATPLRREPRRGLFLLVALALVSMLLAHDALMAAAPPAHPSVPIVVAAGADAQHPTPDDPSHPAACGTVQAAAPRAGDVLVAPARFQSLTLPVPGGGHSVVVPAAPGPLGRAMPRAHLQIWRV